MEVNLLLAFNKQEFDGQYPRLLETPRLFIPWDIVKVISGNVATIIYLMMTDPTLYTLLWLIFPPILNNLGYFEGWLYAQSLLWRNISYTNRYFAAHFMINVMHVTIFPYTLYDWFFYP